MPRRQSRDEYNAYMREYILARYHRRKAEWTERLGGACASCGSTAEDLQFDHVDPATKSFTIGRLWSMADATVEAELAKCQLLCKPCHQTKTTSEWKERRTHGAVYAAVQKKCPCEKCVAFKADYARRRRERRRATRG